MLAAGLLLHGEARQEA